MNCEFMENKPFVISTKKLTKMALTLNLTHFIKRNETRNYFVQFLFPLSMQKTIVKVNLITKDSIERDFLYH